MRIFAVSLTKLTSMNVRKKSGDYKIYVIEVLVNAMYPGRSLYIFWNNFFAHIFLWGTTIFSLRLKFVVVTHKINDTDIFNNLMNKMYYNFNW